MAICHRDNPAGGHVQIRIFESGLEVWNPGGLPHDISVEALYTQHHSHPRNRIVAAAFYRARLIEHWGTGTLRIIGACEERGMANPEFSAVEGGFRVRFSSPEVSKQNDLMAAVNFTERQRKTIDYIRQYGAITSFEYQKLVAVKKRQAQKDLTAMVAANILIIEGRGPSIRYRMRDSAR